MTRRDLSLFAQSWRCRLGGEGFDDARLDTLFPTMPISWRGTLAQYALIASPAALVHRISSPVHCRAINTSARGVSSMRRRAKPRPRGSPNQVRQCEPLLG